MSADNGLSDGFWCLFGLSGGQIVIGRVAGSAESSASIDELRRLEAGWIELDAAFSFTLIPASSPQGAPMLAPMCFPFGGLPDERIPVNIRVENITSVVAIKDMPNTSRAAIAKHVQQARRVLMNIRAASSGIVT